jgi:hypothetical protein
VVALLTLPITIAGGKIEANGRQSDASTTAGGP